MNQNDHTSMIELLSVQITGDAEIVSTSKIPLETLVSTQVAPSIAETMTPVAPFPLETKTDIQTKTEALATVPDEKSIENKADIVEGERIYHEALAYIKDAISPAMMKITPQDLQINDTFCKTLFTYAYPDFLDGNWLSPLINWDAKFDVSLFIYPTDSQKIQKYLRRRLTELQSEKYLNQERESCS